MSPVRWARVTVVGVFVLGLVVVVGPALSHLGSLFRDPFVATTETQTVETFDAKGVKTGTEVTTGPASGSLVERSMAAGGVLLLRVAVVSAAAYLAGALVFRTMSGSFPSEIGGVKFVADAGTGLEKVEANIEAVRTKVAALETRMGTSDREVENIRRVATDGVAAVTKFEERLDDALDGVDQLAGAIVALGDELRDLRDRRQ